MKTPYILFCFLILAFSCKKTAPTNSLPPDPAITALNCGAATVSGTAAVGIPYSATITVPYSGGNGGVFSAGTSIASSRITGLTATLVEGTLANGSGNLIYNITGTPAGTGTASFDISFNRQSCQVLFTVGDAPVNQYGTPFANVTDPRDATIYQVNMRAFSSQGNFQGVIARLDSIKALGVNVMYLMPVHPVGAVNSVNSPYCIKDYTAIATEFGNLDDLRSLVAGAHSRNMSVIIDWVANHTSWDNAWISNHKEWYLQNGSGNIVSPPGTGWNDVAQLNFSNAAMRLEMIKNMKYWIYTANVDGFRCDYADGPPFDFWKQAIDTLRNITTHKLLLLGEGNRSNHYTAGFDFTFGFSFFGQLKNIYSNNQPVTGIDALNSSEYVDASGAQQVVRYLSNHDVNGADGTPLELFGGLPGSMAGFVVAAMMKSVPMIYNGQEVGTPFRLSFPFTGADINWALNPGVTAEYKRIIAFRNSSAAIRRGTLISYSSADICAFTKEQATQKVFVASNLRNSTVSYTLPASVANTTWTNAMTGDIVTTSAQVVLPPYTYLVYQK